MEDVKNGILGGLVNLGTELGTKLSNLLDAIIDLPSNIIDLLKLALIELFVPDETPIEDIKEIFNTKYPIIDQIGDIAIGLFDEFSDTNTPPKFTVSINGNTYNIINLDWYSDYKSVVKGILITLAWVYFVQWILKFLPRLLGGID